MKKLISLISLITFLNSCGPKTMPEGYWIDYDKKGLIAFNSEGDIVVISEDNQIITKDEFEIKNIEPDFFSFIPKDGSEIVGFYKATGSDFLLGNWHLTDKPFREKFTYSRAHNEWSLHETDNQQNETKVYFGFYENGDIGMNMGRCQYTFSVNKDSLVIFNELDTIKFVRGSPDLSDDNLSLYLEKLNSFSQSNTNWRGIQDVDFFNLNSENQIQYNNQLFKGDLSGSQRTVVKISPTSENEKFAVVYVEDKGIFVCDLERMTSHKMDIYSPYTWLSWSPELDFVIFHHYYEADGTLYSYDLRAQVLTELSFSSEYNIDAEQLIFDVEKLKWYSPSAFEIPVTINCNPYNSETNCDELGHEQVLRSKTYRYDVKLDEIVETK